MRKGQGTREEMSGLALHGVGLCGLFDWFDYVLFGVERLEALGVSSFQEQRRCRDEDDLGAAEHFAGYECGSELEGVGPAEAGAVEELTGSFEDGRIQWLLYHAGRFDAQDLKGGSGVLVADVSGAFATADGRVNFERRGSGDQFAVILDRLHEADQDVGTGFLHEELREGRGLEKVAVHSFPRSS